jgi:hypothetical protein
MPRLLLNEYPLVILPSLAVKIGLNEAIFLQQLHYWLQKSDHEIDGYKWVYNTYEDWQKQLPFFCLRTIKTIVSSLVKRGLIICRKLGNDKRNRTNWYAINYELLHNASCKSCTMDSANLTPCSIYTETTSETTYINTDAEAAASCDNEKEKDAIQKDSGSSAKNVGHSTQDVGGDGGGDSLDRPKRLVKSIKKDRDRDEFEDLWLRYPKRYGTNSKEAAYRAYKARREEKESQEVLAKGVENYLAYCEAESFIGTKWVMQGSKFFGRDKHYLNYQEKQKERTLQDALIERLCT